MNQKMLLINSSNIQRNLLAKILSDISGHELLHNRTSNEWGRLYNIEDSSIDEWENQFLKISSSFTDWIKQGYKKRSFISVDAPFSEALSLKSRLKENSVDLNPHEIMMLKSLLNITGRYTSKNKYVVAHVCNIETKLYDDLSIKFYNRYNINYKIYDYVGDIRYLVEQIIRDFEMPVLQPLEMPICQAEKVLNHKNWKS